MSKKKVKLLEGNVTIYIGPGFNILTKTPEGKYIGTNAWGLIYEEDEVEVYHNFRELLISDIQETAKMSPETPLKEVIRETLIRTNRVPTDEIINSLYEEIRSGQCQSP